MIKQTDMAWLAGVIDGEGSIHIQLVHDKNGSGKPMLLYRARVSIVNSSLSMLEKVVAIFKELGVRWHVSYAYSSKSTINTAQLMLINYRAIETVLTSTLPYLVAKREQAEVMLDFARRASVRRGLPTAERDVYRSRLHDLNFRSEPELVETVRRARMNALKIQSELHGDMQSTAEMTVPVQHIN